MQRVMTSGMTARQPMENIAANTTMMQVGKTFVKNKYINNVQDAKANFGLPVCYFRLAAGGTGSDDSSNNLLPAFFDLIRVATLHPEQGRTILLCCCLSDPLQ